MEEILLYFLTGMLGAEFVSRIQDKKMKLPVLLLSIVLFVFLQFVILLSMYLRYIIVFFNSGLMDKSIINYQVVVIYPFGGALLFFLGLKVLSRYGSK